MDYQGLPPADVYLMCEPDAACCRSCSTRCRAAARQRWRTEDRQPAGERRRSVDRGRRATRSTKRPRSSDVCIAHCRSAGTAPTAHFRHPLDYLGDDGGGGVGSGPGLAVGAALALKGSGRLPVGILGDGDFLMGVTALWTAAHYQIPLPDGRREQPLVLQRRAAPGARRQGARPRRSRTAGSASASTSPTSTSPRWRARRAPTASARASRSPNLKAAVEKAIEAVREGRVCVVDVRVVPGYDTNMSGAPASASRRQ